MLLELVSKRLFTAREPICSKYELTSSDLTQSIQLPQTLIGMHTVQRITVMANLIRTD